MKLNLEIELEWLDEEMNLEETVKQQIIEGVVGKIRQKTEEQVKQKIDNLINETTVNKINELTTTLFTEFLTREVYLTDSWGSKVKSYPNVEAIVKERFDNFLTERVDENGKVSNYSNKFTRIEYIVDSKLKEFANTFTTNAVKRVSEEIQNHVKEGLTQKLGAELMKVLKVEKLLQLPAK